MVESRVALVEAEVERLCRELGPGALLPGERELAERCGVSRSTVRLALSELTARRLVERRHGAGTYARSTSPAQPLEALSFRDDMRRRGLVPSTRLLGFERAPAGDGPATALGLGPDDVVLRVDRLRLADGEPMARELLHVPETVAPCLVAADLECGASWYDLLGHRYRRWITDGSQTAEPVLVTGGDAEMLGVPEGRPGWRFVRTSRDQDGEVVEYVEALVRADRYLVELRLSPPRSSPGRAVDDRPDGVAP